MKTKITSKNKNVVNIKINTEKKGKKQRQKRSRPSGSPKGSSSYNRGGYGVAPPIIIQPHQPMVFPQYNPPVGQINQTHESNHINTPVVQQQQQTVPTPYRLPVPTPSTSFINPLNTSPVPMPSTTFINPTNTKPVSTPSTTFINPTNTTPDPTPLTPTTTESLYEAIRRWKPITGKKDDNFINDPSIRPISLTQSTADKYPSPLKLQDFYKEGDDEVLNTNPLPIPTLRRSISEPGQTPTEQSNQRLAQNNYYQKNTSDYTEEKYNILLNKWNSINPNSKIDGDFVETNASGETVNKKASRGRFNMLVGKINKYERNLNSKKNKQTNRQQTQEQPQEQSQEQLANEPLDVIPLTPSVKKKKKLVIKDIPPFTGEP